MKIVRKKMNAYLNFFKSISGRLFSRTFYMHYKFRALNIIINCLCQQVAEQIRYKPLRSFTVLLKKITRITVWYNVFTFLISLITFIFAQLYRTLRFFFKFLFCIFLVGKLFHAHFNITQVYNNICYYLVTVYGVTFIKSTVITL